MDTSVAYLGMRITLSAFPFGHPLVTAWVARF